MHIGHTRTDGRAAFLTDASKRLAIGGALIAGACILGSGLILAGGIQELGTLGMGAAVIIAMAGLGCILLDIAAITAVRFTFIASFFFKGELNLFKVDEVEDPSGFNLSLTLLTAIMLLVYDWATSNRSGEKLLPGRFSYLLTALFGCAAISVIFGGSTTLGWFSLWSLFSSILI